VTCSHIVLLGPMAAGKTTLGLALARALDTDFIDSDQVILELTGLTAAEIASGAGVSELHRLERKVISDALLLVDRSVIAAAASVVDDEAMRTELGRHLCLWVDAEPSTLSTRRSSGAHRRALDEDQARQLNLARRRTAAELIIGQVDTTTSSVEQSAALAMNILSDHDQFESP
jgi:shikimate kinase